MYRNVSIKPSVQKLVNERRGEESWSVFIESLIKIRDLVERGFLVPVDVERMTREEKVLLSVITGDVVVDKSTMATSPLQHEVPKAILQAVPEPVPLPQVEKLTYEHQEDGGVGPSVEQLVASEVKVQDREGYDSGCPFCVHPACVELEDLYFNEQSKKPINERTGWKFIVISEHLNNHTM